MSNGGGGGIWVWVGLGRVLHDDNGDDGDDKGEGQPTQLRDYAHGADANMIHKPLCSARAVTRNASQCGPNQGRRHAASRSLSHQRAKCNATRALARGKEQ